MKEHKFNRNILFVTLLLLIIVMVAIYSGIMLYDKYKKSQIQEDFSLLNQQILLDDLYNSYLKDINSQEKKCEVLNDQIISQFQISDLLFEKLRQINRNAIVETDNNLKYMYVLTNIKLWLHYNEINKECSTDIKTILYFYPELSGYSSEKAKLDASTKVFEYKINDLLERCDYKSFALPYIDYIPILKQIIDDIGVEQAPAVYINGKIYYDIPRYLNAEFLKEINCE